VSRKLNVLYIIFNNIAFFIRTLFVRLKVLVGMLVTCGKHLHYRIFSIKRGYLGPQN